MIKSFKADLTPDFLLMMENSTVGKAITRIISLSTYELLTEFELYLPNFPNLEPWLIVKSGINFPSNDMDYVILFLKYAWLYSKKEQNEHVEDLARSVSKEITQFDTNLSIENLQTKLVKSDADLEIQKATIFSKEKQLKRINKKLQKKIQKDERLSATNSRSASEPRGCMEVTKLLKDLVLKNSCKTIELWSRIPNGRDGSELYRENKKIHHEGCSCNEFGLSAFYSRIQHIKFKLIKNSS